jgi:hypothetical protein
MMVDDIRLDVTLDCPTPAAPGLVAPANGGSVVDTTPTFSWNGVADATDYVIQVDNNHNFGSPVVDQVYPDTSFTPATPLAAGVYYWRVSAYNIANGCAEYGPWSAVRSFSIAGVDLVPMAPTGYDAPGVPNSVRLTTTAGSVLYAGKSAFVDWYFGNIGSATAAGSFHVEVRLDGEAFVRYPFSDYSADTMTGFDDWSHVVATPGWHTLAIVVDPDNAISETNENNNVWEQAFYWEPVNGWWGRYYNNEEATGDPVLVRDDPAIQFAWESDSPAPGIVDSDRFSVYWERNVYFDAGTYRFQLNRDDGLRFWIDGALKLDYWNISVGYHEVVVDLSQGTHFLELAMFEHAGGATARLAWDRCYRLSLQKSGRGAAPEPYPPQSPGCVAGFYLAGAQISLTATPDTNWHIAGWNGTDNDGGAAETNMVTMPNRDHVVGVEYALNSGQMATVTLPVVLHLPSCFAGPNEVEPNDRMAEANGPLCSGFSYQGAPDRVDTFYFDASAAGGQTVELLNYPDTDAQLQLYYGSTSSAMIAYDPEGADGYRLTLTNRPPGRYYIVVYNPSPAVNARYTLRAGFPGVP